MSIATWRGEFYPVPADVVACNTADCEGVALVEHSLRKWRGLTVENQRLHHVKLQSTLLWDDDAARDPMRIDASTCALCAYYQPEEEYDEDLGEEVTDCHGCPLAELLDGSCDRRGQPFRALLDRSDPLPMIAALERTLDSLTSTYED